MGEGGCQVAEAAGEKATLLEAKAAADTSACTGNAYYSSCPLDSWTADTEPCGDGYDDKNGG